MFDKKTNHKIIILLFLLIGCKAQENNAPHMKMEGAFKSNSIIRNEKTVCDFDDDIYFMNSILEDKQFVERIVAFDLGRKTHEVMIENAFDAIDFSPEGNKLATVCIANSGFREICIFRINKNNKCMTWELSSTIKFPDYCEVIEDGYSFTNSYISIADIEWSVDGDKLAILCSPSSEKKVCILSVNGESSCWHSEIFNIEDIDWGLTGEFLVQTHEEQIYIFDESGNMKEFITYGQYPKWSPDAKKIAFVKKNLEYLLGNFEAGIALIDIITLEEEWVFTPFETEDYKEFFEKTSFSSVGFDCSEYYGMCQLDWVIDSSHLVFQAQGKNPFMTYLYLLNLVTGEFLILSEDLYPIIDSPVWRP